MGAHDAIGKGVAAANLGVAKGIGVQMTFSARGASGVSLYVLILKSEVLPVRSESGQVTEKRVMTIQVATGQTGFTVATNDQEPVTAGDKFTYLSRNFYVGDPIGKDQYERTYTLTLVEDKPLVS